ncbi:MAG TPA: CU044_2847 family protein [Pseudonocardiaceae bacterium]
MAVLMEVPLEDGAVLLVEVDPEDVPGGVKLAPAEQGAAEAKSAQSLSKSLEQLNPVLRTVKEHLVASMPEHYTAEFGVKFGGETGIVLAKGTAEANMKITLTWDRSAGCRVAPVGGYETAVVRLVVWTAGRPAITGMGVLVGPRQVVTCAQVVNLSLGRDQREQARPDPSAVVQVEFPLLPGVPVRTARVQEWVPPRANEGDGDVAGLVLSEDAPIGAIPARFKVEAGNRGERLRVFGYPDAPVGERGVWVDVDLGGDVSAQLLQVESHSDQTIKGQPGYSGSPVWQDSTGTVVGLLQVTPFVDGLAPGAHLLPADMVAEAWEAPFDYLPAPANPYRGLEAFTADHAEVFFGRDRDIELLTARVTARPVVVVVGPSGVGKSSLVQAGLVPRLRESGSWSVVLVCPGQNPWHRLAAGLLRAQRDPGPEAPVVESRNDVERQVERLRNEGLSPVSRFLRSRNRSLLIVIDQFEELLASGQQLDPQLLDLLLAPVDAVDDPIRIVIILRADYLPALLAVPGIGPRLEQSLYLLSPLTEQELHAVVQCPAKARRVRFETVLVNQIVRDAEAESLPLLQFTLTRLWETQRCKTLCFDGYHLIGGVSGALDRFAEQQMSTLPDDAVGIVEQLLLRLVHTPAEDSGLTIRKRAYQSDLPVAEWEAAQRLAETRLVIVDTDYDRGPYAQLAHEALIKSWQRLRHLVRDNADLLGLLAWMQQRAAKGHLLPEARLAKARGWVEGPPHNIFEPVESRETAAETRLRELSHARERAEAAARRAEALRLAADAELALRSAQPPATVALALGVESVLTEPTRQGDLALRHVLRLHPRTHACLDHDGPVWAVAFAPEGLRVATASADGSARIFDTTGTELVRLDHDGPVQAVAFAPDGTRVATASADGSVRIFDTTGTELVRLDHDGPVQAVAFAPDGTRVATASGDRSARVFDAATGTELARLDHDDWVGMVAFAPDGVRVATASGDGSARVFDAATGAELARLDHDGPVWAVTFSPDGDQVATGSGDGSARVFDAATGTELVRLDHDGPVLAVAFAPGGTWVGTASADRSARVFDAATGAELARLDHDGRVRAVAFAPEGTRVGTASGDGSARVFDAAIGTELARLDHDGPVRAVAFAPDGTRVATASADRSTRVFDAATGAELARLDHNGRVRAVAFAPDGTRVATASADGSARVFDAATGAELARLDHNGPVQAVAFAPDGTRVATASVDGSARVFDAATATELIRLGHDGPVWAVAFAPDGTRVATASVDGSARVFDAVTGAELTRLDHDGPVQAVAFAPDGTRVATASADGSARVFDAATGIEQARLDHDDWVYAVAFAPDGTRVATGSADGSARVFEAERTLLVQRVFKLMTRPLWPAELRRYSLPWNCRHIEQWLRRQAAEGDFNAARDLVDVLLSRRTEDDVSEAESWCEWLSDHDDADMRAALGAIAVRRGQYDQAVELWRGAADDGDASAALKLAPVEAVDGHRQRALTLLRAAVDADFTEAATYAAIIERTDADGRIPSLETAATSGNTNALNFLGLAALSDGKIVAAREYWTRSAELGDCSAPLLLARVDKA